MRKSKEAAATLQVIYAAALGIIDYCEWIAAPDSMTPPAH